MVKVYIYIYIYIIYIYIYIYIYILEVNITDTHNYFDDNFSSTFHLLTTLIYKGITPQV